MNQRTLLRNSGVAVASTSQNHSTGSDPPGRRQEFCHFADTPSPSSLKCLLKEEGV